MIAVDRPAKCLGPELRGGIDVVDIAVDENAIET
jgi:hypothetical protein